MKKRLGIIAGILGIVLAVIGIVLKQKENTAVSVIGGINKGNTGRFKPMGIDGLAVVSAIIAQSDIKAAAAELKDLFCGKEKKHGF